MSMPATRAFYTIHNFILIQQGEEFRVCVIEKASTVGGHILSGACIETTALDELIPDWKDKDSPLNTPVTALGNNPITAVQGPRKSLISYTI